MEEATHQLRSYMAEIFRHGAPFKLCTFRMLQRSYPPDEAPRSSARVPRRSEGTHSDPTPFTAIANIEGIAVNVPEYLIVPHATIADIVLGMPGHLERSLRCVVVGEIGEAGGVKRFEYVFEAAGYLGISSATAYRRVDEALDWLGRALYAERWVSACGVAA